MTEPHPTNPVPNLPRQLSRPRPENSNNRTIHPLRLFTSRLCPPVQTRQRHEESDRKDEQQRRRGTAHEHGKPSSSTGKDTPKTENKWPFSRKSLGSAKDVQLQAGAEEEEVEGMRVDFYLVVFLKFIASIVPTIEVDSTTSFWVDATPTVPPSLLTGVSFTCIFFTTVGT